MRVPKLYQILESGKTELADPVLRRLGFVLGEDADEAHIEAELPAGWVAIEQGEAGIFNSVTHLFDEQTRPRMTLHSGITESRINGRRADIPYGYLTLHRVFEVIIEDNAAHDYPEYPVWAWATIRAMGVQVWESQECQAEDEKELERVVDRVTAEAEAWLDGRFPHWRDPFAYRGTPAIPPPAAPTYPTLPTLIDQYPKYWIEGA